MADYVIDPEYVIDDRYLFKVIKKNKRYIELALLPMISHDHIKIDDIRGKSEIFYNLDADVNKLWKFKVTNKTYNSWDWGDKFKDFIVRDQKIVFETVYYANKMHYNKKTTIPA